MTTDRTDSPTTFGEDNWTLTTLRPEERMLLDRMLQFYFYDFSEIDPDDIDEAGRFHIDGYDKFGVDPGHDAWILRVSGKPAGFALVDFESPWVEYRDYHYIHEFHVLRAYRRRGLGHKMACAIFDHYPGLWQIEQIGPNAEAQAFWRDVVARYTGGEFTERVAQGRRFPLHIQEFDTRNKVR